MSDKLVKGMAAHADIMNSAHIALQKIAMANINDANKYAPLKEHLGKKCNGSGGGKASLRRWSGT